MTGTRGASFCLLVWFVCAPLSAAQRQEAAKDAVTVHVMLNKTLFAVGEPIQLNVMISNAGSQPLLIPNRISFFGDSQGELIVELTDEKGAPVSGGVGMAFDCKNYKEAKLTYEFVFNNYVLLRPATSYTQQISLLVLFPALQPGSYRLKSSYSSSGLTALGCENLNKEDIARFPFKAWHGSTGANEVSFAILPKVTKR
jgi:hypothetical protein